MSAEIGSDRNYYVVLGKRGDYKRWCLARRYGFLNGGNPRHHWKPLRRLRQGDWVFAYVGGHGYVGIGVVTGEMQHIRDARVTVNGEEEPLIEQRGIDAHFVNAAASDDEDVLEMVVPVKWYRTSNVEGAIPPTDLFYNQTTVCELRQQQAKHRNTIDIISTAFGLDKD